jgi:hypothetical protein
MLVWGCANAVHGCVPAVVPSLVQSWPAAARTSVPWWTCSTPAELSMPCGPVSRTSTVPAAVPSLPHSSRPLTPSSAVKSTRPW